MKAATAQGKSAPLLEESLERVLDFLSVFKSDDFLAKNAQEAGAAT
jgi:hypothetical protein